MTRELNKSKAGSLYGPAFFVQIFSLGNDYAKAKQKAASQIWLAAFIPIDQCYCLVTTGFSSGVITSVAGLFENCEKFMSCDPFATLGV